MSTHNRFSWRNKQNINTFGFKKKKKTLIKNYEMQNMQVEFMQHNTPAYKIL